MHICYLTQEYPKPGYSHGGIGTFLKSIAESLAQKNIRVTVISTDPAGPGELVSEGLLTIHYQKKSTWPALKFIDYAYRVNRQIADTHQQHPIDIVEAPEVGFAFVKKIPGIRFVIRMNGGHHFFTEAANGKLNWQTAWKEKKSFGRADFLLAVSQYVNKRTAAHLGFDPSKTTIIANGTDTATFTPGNADGIVPGLIVFAGTVCEKKGIRQLVMALPEVRKKFPKTRLAVLGDLKAVDRERGGLYMDYLRTFIDPSVEDAIEFVGFVNKDELRKWVHAAEVCVYPSHMEALPFAWVEVLAMQKLLIGGNTGPGPEVIDNGVTGLLCDPHNPADIAQKIIYAFEHPAEARQLAANGRKAALEKFDAEKLHLQSIAFYQEVIDGKHLK